MSLTFPGMQYVLVIVLRYDMYLYHRYFQRFLSFRWAISMITLKLAFEGQHKNWDYSALSKGRKLKLSQQLRWFKIPNFGHKNFFIPTTVSRVVSLFTIVNKQLWRILPNYLATLKKSFFDQNFVCYNIFKFWSVVFPFKEVIAISNLLIQHLKR